MRLYPTGINFKSGKTIDLPHTTLDQRNNRIAFFLANVNKQHRD
jgi:hypothetical protein